MFEIQQVFKDPRSGEDFATSYMSFPTKAEALKEARKLKGRWRIIETRIVAWSKETA
jgi:hypothetical protein